MFIFELQYYIFIMEEVNELWVFCVLLNDREYEICSIQTFYAHDVNYNNK